MSRRGGGGRGGGGPRGTEYSAQHRGGRGGGGGSGGGGGGMPGGQRDAAVTSLIEYMSSMGSVSMQVDSGALSRALESTRLLLSEFIREEAHRSILVHNRAEGLTVWLQAPHGADIKNSFSFTKKELRCDPKSFWGLSLSMQSGMPADMPTLSEEQTQAALASAMSASPLALAPNGAGGQYVDSGAERKMTKEETEAMEAKRAEKREAELKAAERAKQLREEREKESFKFEGTWAESESDEEGKGPLDLGFIPPPTPTRPDQNDRPSDAGGGKGGGMPRSAGGGEIEARGAWGGEGANVRRVTAVRRWRRAATGEVMGGAEEGGGWRQELEGE